jgi:hypothetical protein
MFGARFTARCEYIMSINAAIAPAEGVREWPAHPGWTQVPVGGDDMSFGRNRWHDVHVAPRIGSEREFPPPAL